VRNPRLVIALFLSVVVCSGLLAAFGLRSLAADTERVDARYRDQANAALSAVRTAFASVLQDVRNARAPSIAVRIASDGTLVEPALATRSRAASADALQSRDDAPNGEQRADAATNGPRDPVLHRFLSDEIDRLEREGKGAEARARLRAIATKPDDRWLAGWALSTLAAIERNADDVHDALDDWSSLAGHFAGIRDERGVDQSLAARFELAQHVASDPEHRAIERPQARLDLYDDLIAECERTDAPSVWALKARVAALAFADLASVRNPPHDAMLVRWNDIAERDRRSELALRIAAAIEQDIEPALASWMISPANEGALVSTLSRSPIDSPNAAPRRAVVALRHENDGSWNGGALDLERVVELALARPEIAAYATLGIATSVSSGDGNRLAFTGGAEADLRGDPLARERAAPPFDELNLAAFGVDRAGFLARERKRFVLMGALSALALAVASVAGLATLRAVKREVDTARSRDAFVAAVTHELKAPLASIRLLAEVLGRGGVEDAKVREFASRTVTESDRLTRLVDSILEWAKIEHAESAAREHVDVNEVAARALETFRPLALERGFDVVLHAPHEPTIVLGDADALESALLNLLDNALKYSDVPHAIEIDVAREGDGAYASLAVLDRGRGVQSDEVERIFEPFRRVGDELVRERPGVGLGLALVHRIALAHGGRATCTPREGGGSRFAIEIPLAEVER
jgi:signal transduction histidine kinase